jgi:hypothetical protein
MPMTVPPAARLAGGADGGGDHVDEGKGGGGADRIGEVMGGVAGHRQCFGPCHLQAAGHGGQHRGGVFARAFEQEADARGDCGF